MQLTLKQRRCNIATKNLRVFVKVENLLYRMYPALVNFPKAEKFALSEQIKENFFELLKYIALGNKVKSKRLSYLQEADGHLEVLKVLIKLSHQRKYISTGFFRDIDEEFTNIGKMLTGYIRSSCRR